MGPETMPFSFSISACFRKSLGHRQQLWLAMAPLMAGLVGAAPVEAVSLSAYYNDLLPVTNSMGLPPNPPLAFTSLERPSAWSVPPWWLLLPAA
jgi:hypothetical protein